MSTVKGFWPAGPSDIACAIFASSLSVSQPGPGNTPGPITGQHFVFWGRAHCGMPFFLRVEAPEPDRASTTGSLSPRQRKTMLLYMHNRKRSAAVALEKHCCTGKRYVDFPIGSNLSVFRRFHRLLERMRKRINGVQISNICSVSLTSEDRCRFGRTRTWLKFFGKIENLKKTPLFVKQFKGFLWNYVHRSHLQIITHKISDDNWYLSFSKCRKSTSKTKYEHTEHQLLHLVLQSRLSYE